MPSLSQVSIPTPLVLICSTEGAKDDKRTLFPDHTGSPVLIGRATAVNKSAKSKISNLPAPNNAKFHCLVMSKNHAELSWVANQVFIKDTNSTHGTYHRKDGSFVRIPPNTLFKLQNQMVIRFGRLITSQQDGSRHSPLQVSVRLPKPLPASTSSGTYGLTDRHFISEEEEEEEEEDDALKKPFDPRISDKEEMAFRKLYLSRCHHGSHGSHDDGDSSYNLSSLPPSNALPPESTNFDQSAAAEPNSSQERTESDDRSSAKPSVSINTTSKTGDSDQASGSDDPKATNHEAEPPSGESAPPPSAPSSHHTCPCSRSLSERVHDTFGDDHNKDNVEQDIHSKHNGEHEEGKKSLPKSLSSSPQSRPPSRFLRRGLVNSLGCEKGDGENDQYSRGEHAGGDEDLNQKGRENAEEDVEDVQLKHDHQESEEEEEEEEEEDDEDDGEEDDEDDGEEDDNDQEDDDEEEEEEDGDTDESDEEEDEEEEETHEQLTVVRNLPALDRTDRSRSSRAHSSNSTEAPDVFESRKLILTAPASVDAKVTKSLSRMNTSQTFHSSLNFRPIQSGLINDTLVREHASNRLPIDPTDPKLLSSQRAASFATHATTRASTANPEPKSSVIAESNPCDQRRTPATSPNLARTPNSVKRARPREFDEDYEESESSGSVEKSGKATSEARVIAVCNRCEARGGSLPMHERKRPRFGRAIAAAKSLAIFALGGVATVAGILAFENVADN